MNKKYTSTITISREEFAHNYNMKTNTEMAKLYKVCPGTIASTAKKLGITRNRVGCKLRVV